MILIPFFRIHLILRIYVCSSNKINFLSLLFCCRRRTKNLFRYAFSHATSLISKLNVCLRYVKCFISIQIHCIRNCVRVDSEFNVVHWKIGMWCITSDTEQKTSFSRVIRIRFFHLHINDLFHNQKMLIHSLQDLNCSVHYCLVLSTTYFYVFPPFYFYVEDTYERSEIPKNLLVLWGVVSGFTRSTEDRLFTW